MLILTRNLHETLIIRKGEIEIKVKVARISSYNVRLGIEAPAEFEIIRRELSNNFARKTENRPETQQE